MKTLEEVKKLCRIDDDGHWIWDGATSKAGQSRILAPDFTQDPTGATQRTQHGKRAVWHINTGKPIEEGYRVYSKCHVHSCLKPTCLVCETDAEYGARQVASGRLRGSLRRRLLAGRASASTRALTDEQIAEIMASQETAKALAKKFGVHRCTVGIYRRGVSKAVPNFFQGLIR